jgi:hypothetical protein
MGVCNLDYRIGDSAREDAPTERLYLDDRLIEDFADSGSGPVSGLLVARIESDNRPGGWSRRVLFTVVGLVLAFVVSLTVRSRSASRHGAPRALTRNPVSATTVHRQKKSVGKHRRELGQAHRRARPHARRQYRASRERDYSQYTARPTLPVVPTHSARVIPRSRMLVRARRRGEEFGFER